MEVSLKSPCNLKDKETKIANANQLPKTTIITAGEQLIKFIGIMRKPKTNHFSENTRQSKS